MDILKQGRLVWVVVPDKNGHNAYPRPVVILTPTNEIAGSEIVYGVVASNTAHGYSPRPPYFVELPSQRDGLVSTRLKEPTVACCNWLVPIDKTAIMSYGGVVYGRLLEEVVRTTENYHASRQEQGKKAAADPGESRGDAGGSPA